MHSRNVPAESQLLGSDTLFAFNLIIKDMKLSSTDLQGAIFLFNPIMKQEGINKKILCFTG